MTATAKVVLVLGGTRSGKSCFGEQLAARLGDRVTAVIPRTDAEPDDPDLAARIAVHRARRPSTWNTLECDQALPNALAAVHGVVFVDSLGTWVANAPDFSVDTTGLVAALRTRHGPTVLVSEEVGLSVHPPTEPGRRFTDRLGELNTAVAAVAHQVVFVAAGRAVLLDPFDVIAGSITGSG
jgi:adenosyl cobinamide kinase/adenosyl cobinamide phosphate guanylyltransferase